MNVTLKSAAKTTCLPGLLPRIQELFGSGFSFIAYFIAQAFAAVRLLPPTHPYLQPKNAGKFGMIAILTEARRGLIFNKENLDKIIIYFTVCAGVFMLFFQVVVLLLQLLVRPAHAQAFGVWISNFLVNNSPQEDIAFRLMDRVFCLNDLGGTVTPVYNSDVISSGACPTGITEALHLLFQYYNIGIVSVAIIIGLYLAASIVGETAQTGTPFGRRFNTALVPLRLIVAVALLVPFSYGFNGAQHITFRVVKWGSNLGTNAWNEFLTSLNASNYTPGGAQASSLLATPNAPQLNNFLEYMFLLHVCRYAEETINGRENISAWQVNGNDKAEMNAGYTYEQAVNFAIDHKSEVIELRFGIGDPGLNVQEYKEEGGILPVCGGINIQVTDVSNTASPGSYEIQKQYFENIIRDMFWDNSFRDYAKYTVKKITPLSYVSAQDTHKDPTNTLYPRASDIETQFKDRYRQSIQDAIDDGVTAQANAPGWLDYAQTYGWAGAGIWFNKIAELNGTLASAAHNLPTADLYPMVMEHIAKERSMADAAMGENERYSPYLSDGQIVQFQQPGDLYVGISLYYAQSFWPQRLEHSSGNTFSDLIKAWLGLEGLYNIRDNVDIHPLAQLSTVGRSLIESAIMNLGAAGVAGLTGFVLDKLSTEQGIGTMLAKSISSISKDIAFLGLAMGFLLFYIIPFLPFIYFFFAVGGWLKSIFEAMVGLPLWAIAHIRIDGDGIPGPTAMNGYYLILEIFLRPILIVLGMIAGITILAAEVSVLNQIWDLVTTNIAGRDPSAVAAGTTGEIGSSEYFRSAVDSFFYLVIYTIVVYMMAMSSFKLIDQVPKSILRWIGSSVMTLNDYGEDAAGKLVQYSYMGSQSILASSEGLLFRN